MKTAPSAANSFFFLAAFLSDQRETEDKKRRLKHCEACEFGPSRCARMGRREDRREDLEVEED